MRLPRVPLADPRTIKVRFSEDASRSLMRSLASAALSGRSMTFALPRDGRATEASRQQAHERSTVVITGYAQGERHDPQQHRSSG